MMKEDIYWKPGRIVMDIIRGDRVKLNLLKLEDALFMKNWGVHETPLLKDYNFPYLDDYDVIEWYDSKKSGRNKIYFAIYNEEERFIGYLGIKRIRRIRKEATLGIVFDPNYVNKGYGTDTIKVFLNYFFYTMNMKKLFLEVASFNKRAVRCYEKCGFIKSRKYLGKFYNQSIDMNNPHFLEEEDSFIMKRGKIYNYIYRMKIDEKTFYGIGEESGGDKI